MSEVKFELQRNGELVGVFSVSELKQLARNGKLRPVDLVREVGTANWQEASSVQIPEDAASPIPSPPREPDPQPVGQRDRPLEADDDSDALSELAYMAWPVTALVELLRRFWGGKRFATETKWATRAGHVLAMIFAITYILHELIRAGKSGEWGGPMIEVILACLLLPVLQYVAHQFISASNRLLASSPTVVNNTALLDIFGLIAFVACVGILIFSIYTTITFADTDFLKVGIGSAILAYLVSSLAFSPESLNIGSGESTSAGDEAVGILTFFVKSLLVLGPFVYAGGGLIACLSLMYETKYLIDEEFLMYTGGIDSAQVMFAAGVYPLVLYVLFLVYYIFVDLLRAIFNLDRNLQAMRNHSSDV